MNYTRKRNLLFKASPRFTIGRALLGVLIAFRGCNGSFAILVMLVILFSESALAQHSHGRRNTIDFEHETVPAHDEILAKAPEHLILRFSEYVRLVKLTLKAEDLKMVGVDFQFTNAANRVFIQEIPELKKAAYYTAEWAALNTDNVMIYGYFCFSFGPGAVTPTTIINSRVFPSTPF